ncbi:MAG: hypothetical protein WBI20_05355, partial [Burkholderiaceae bacterium]
QQPALAQYWIGRVAQYSIGAKSSRDRLITEREIPGFCVENEGDGAAALKSEKLFSQGERAKEIPTDKSRDFEIWWRSRTPKQNSLYQPLSTKTGQ